MPVNVYRYAFAPEVPFEEVEATLVRAIQVAENLYSPSQVQLDAGHYLDPDCRVCVVDAGTAVGRDLNKLFVAFFSLEFGTDEFEVKRVGGAASCDAVGAAT